MQVVAISACVCVHCQQLAVVGGESRQKLLTAKKKGVA